MINHSTFWKIAELVASGQRSPTALGRAVGRSATTARKHRDRFEAGLFPGDGNKGQGRPTAQTVDKPKPRGLHSLDVVGMIEIPLPHDPGTPVMIRRHIAMPAPGDPAEVDRLREVAPWLASSL